MLILIAWRNIWRNKVRSLVVMLSIAVGLWAGLTVMSFSFGMYQGHIQHVILYQLSHLQLHHPNFRSELALSDSLRNADALERGIRALPQVKATVRRVVSSGMVVTASGSAGVLLVGTVPGDEQRVTGLDSMIMEGSYFTDVTKKEMIIGAKLAEKLHAKVGGKVVVMMQDAAGEMVSGAFRIKGIFRTRNSEYDQNNVFVPIGKLQDLASVSHSSHEMAVLLRQGAELQNVQRQIKQIASGVEVMNWMELSPELDLVVNSFDTYMYIFMGIILLALMFGIVNTMLMAVLERQREVGMLMAIGMNRSRVFGMVMLETAWLAVVGGPVGILFGHLTIAYFATNGVDLSQYSEALAMYGFSNVVYFQLDTGFYLPVLMMTIGVALLSAVYPAMRAIRLEPAQAIRKI
ncbi:MAG: ABC transporter permease [Bacteroidia bacterium]